MILAIIGSRGFSDYTLLTRIINRMQEKFNISITEIVSGGAKGADKLGAKYAIDNNLGLKEFYADWNLHGKSAGYIRNHDIINYSDIVVAFWDGKSRGTKHSINLAKKQSKLKLIVNYVNDTVKIHKTK